MKKFLFLVVLGSLISGWLLNDFIRTYIYFDGKLNYVYKLKQGTVLTSSANGEAWSCAFPKGFPLLTQFNDHYYLSDVGLHGYIPVYMGVNREVFDLAKYSSRISADHYPDFALVPERK